MAEMITACLTYFKASGKYYSEGEIPYLQRTSWHERVDDIRRRHRAGVLPGLRAGAGKEFYVHVGWEPDDVPVLLSPVEVV